MKILAASDIHGNHDTYEWLVDRANSTDAESLLLAGDLLGAPDGFAGIEEAQEQDARRVANTLSRVRCPILFIMGNDDWVELTPSVQRMQTINGRRVDIGRYNFVGYQHTLPFMGGINEKTEAEIAGDLSILRDLFDKNTVFVSHGPACGILDTGVLGDSVGSVSIGELLQSTPFLAHVHGHIHGCFGRQNRHFNVAAGRARRAVVINLPTLEHEVLVPT